MNHTAIEARIEAACREFGFTESWRLWYHPAAWAEQSRPLVLGINPADGGDWETHGRYSQEKGSAYLVESWGQSLVQEPVPQYLRMAGLSIEDVAYANWAPFRTSNEKELKDHPRWSEVRVFCRDLWTDLLAEMQPSCVLCIGRTPREELAKVARRLKWGLSTKELQEGKLKRGVHYTFRVDGSSERRLVSVPYPHSRAKSALLNGELREPLEQYMKVFGAGAGR